MNGNFGFYAGRDPDEFDEAIAEFYRNYVCSDEVRKEMYSVFKYNFHSQLSLAQAREIAINRLVMRRFMENNAPADNIHDTDPELTVLDFLRCETALASCTDGNTAREDGAAYANKQWGITAEKWEYYFEMRICNEGGKDFVIVRKESK